MIIINYAYYKMYKKRCVDASNCREWKRWNGFKKTLDKNAEDNTFVVGVTNRRQEVLENARALRRTTRTHTRSSVTVESVASRPRAPRTISMSAIFYIILFLYNINVLVSYHTTCNAVYQFYIIIIILLLFQFN